MKEYSSYTLIVGNEKYQISNQIANMATEIVRTVGERAKERKKMRYKIWV